MSPTCRRHVANIAKCRQILADIACRPDTEESPTHPIFLNYSRQVQVSPNVRVSYPTIEFLCLNSNNNQEIADMSGIPTCRQMSCRLDTLADTTFSCVCDMTENVGDMSPDTTQNVASWAQKRHADIRHVQLSFASNLAS